MINNLCDGVWSWLVSWIKSDRLLLCLYYETKESSMYLQHPMFPHCYLSNPNYFFNERLFRLLLKFKHFKSWSHIFDLFFRLCFLLIVCFLCISGCFSQGIYLCKQIIRGFLNQVMQILPELQSVKCKINSMLVVCKSI